MKKMNRMILLFHSYHSYHLYHPFHPCMNYSSISSFSSFTMIAYYQLHIAMPSCCFPFFIITINNTLLQFDYGVLRLNLLLKVLYSSDKFIMLVFLIRAEHTSLSSYKPFSRIGCECGHDAQNDSLQFFSKIHFQKFFHYE